MSEVNGKASADAGEVERLRAELAESEKLRDQAIIGAANNLDLAMNLDKENERLRAKLAERDALLIGYKSLLRQVMPCLAMSTNSQSKSYMRQIESALSSSAEPSAPVERDERDERAEFEKRFGPCTCGEDDYEDEMRGWQARAALERKP